jgi:3',5'-cyclic AMP phosphodiesterase CpdA
LHISDLHLSRDNHAFAIDTPDDHNISLSSAIVSALGDKKPGFIVVTGDLTWSGQREEFEWARNCLDNLRSEFGLTNQHFVIIPGNHDLGWVRKDDAREWNGEYLLVSKEAKANYKGFLEDWYKAKFTDELSIARRIFVHGGHTLDILGLNSSSLQQVEEHFAGIGRVPTQTLKRAAHRFGWDEPLRATQVRWLAVHHHVLPVVAQEDPSGASRGFGIAMDAGSQLMNYGHYGVDLVLHGHQHHPYAGYINTLEISNDSKSDKGIHVLGAGSVGVVDKHLGPIRYRTFNLIDLSSGHMVVSVYTTDREAKEFRISYSFRDTPSGWKKES